MKRSRFVQWAANAVQWRHGESMLIYANCFCSREKFSFYALESMIDARLSLDGKGQEPFVLFLCYVFHRNY